jgi:ABC-type Fe3+-hydroxamate transport system substrate-binding protein
MFELAGLHNAVAERGTVGHVGFTFEELLALDPDVIVVSRPLKMPEGPSGDRGGAAEKILYGEASLAGLRAVRERRVVSLPAWLFATGSHELVHGAEVLADEVEALLARLAAQSGAGR